MVLSASGKLQIGPAAQKIGDGKATRKRWWGSGSKQYQLQGPRRLWNSDLEVHRRSHIAM